MIEARIRLLPRIFVTLALVAGTLGAPALAQDSPEARLKKIESEVRALQRKVFPDGASKYFEPQIVPPTSAPVTSSVPPASAPLTDLLGRLDAVEASLARATAQAEENANRMGKLEARLTALEAGPSVAATPALQPAMDSAPPKPSSITGSLAANTAAMAVATAVTPSADRIEAVRGIEKPVSADKGEDDYLYGYRLWEAKFFPEAQQQLKATADKYPRHRRLSYVRNLLGRAYLDDGKPGTAAQVFLQNYQADKAGDRAADSLLYLAVAMTRLKETQRACVALAELADTYPVEVAGRLAGQAASARAAVKCN